MKNLTFLKDHSLLSGRQLNYRSHTIPTKNTIPAKAGISALLFHSERSEESHLFERSLPAKNTIPAKAGISALLFHSERSEESHLLERSFLRKIPFLRKQESQHYFFVLNAVKNLTFLRDHSCEKYHSCESRNLSITFSF